MKVSLDAVTRRFLVTYPIPAGAPDAVLVHAAWAPAGTDAWRPARVEPLLSETALRLADAEDSRAWTGEGVVREHRAAGLRRTLLFDPFPEAEREGVVDVVFRVSVEITGGGILAVHAAPLRADNTDVVAVVDWTRVVQSKLVNAGDPPAEGGWGFRPESGLRSAPGRAPTRPLTVPLALTGWYAILVRTEPERGVRIRLSGDERADTVRSARPLEEVLWAWRKMDRQHLVIGPAHSHTGESAAHLHHVRLVPLTAAALRALEAPYAGARDRRVVAYWEPYSWAFVDDVRSMLWHRERLSAFVDAGRPELDAQVGRFGMKSVYETRVADQLFHSSLGDPVPGDPAPRTDNVGLMQQYTNTLEATLRYGAELGLAVRANFGASNTYPGSPLQSAAAESHPQWLRGHVFRYELPEVRAYVLDQYREVLEIGARDLSIDYCRYPECLDTAETGVLFMRELRRLADGYRGPRGKRVSILARFPAHGVKGYGNFDYAAWAREGLVDFLCPSNFQGRHMSFDVAPYVEAVRGTGCVLLPCLDGLGWGLEMPGLYLGRVRELYDRGLPGIYVYQADGRVLGAPDDRRTMRLLGSSKAVARWWKRDAALRPKRSKGIYLNRPLRDGAYHPWERLRVWLEGIPIGEVEMVLDGVSVNRWARPPYVLGSEEREHDGLLSPGEHTVTVRARDGEGWLERSFTVRGAV